MEQIEKTLRELNALRAVVPEAIRFEGSAAIPVGPLFESVLNKLKETEASIRIIDHIAIPAIEGQRPTDMQYDQVLHRLCSAIGLGEVYPVSNHVQWSIQGLRINTALNSPLIAFSPSTRSFDALALVLHEIGHYVHIRVLTKSEDQALTKCFWGFFQDPTDESRPILAAMRGEFFADAFATLTLGYAYVSSFCAYCMLRPVGPKFDDYVHASADWRVWFVRQALLALGVSEDDRDGPLIRDCVSAHDVQLLSGPRAATKPQPRRDVQAAERYLAACSAILAARNIRLATSIPRPDDGSEQVRRYSQTTDIRTVLLSAAKLKDSLEWSAYVAWERGVAKRIGLPRDSIWKRLRSHFARQARE